MRGSGITIIALSTALLGGACYNPSFEGSAGFKCAKNGECPEGFVCSAQKVCIKPGTPQPDLRADTAGPDLAVDRGVDAQGKDVGADQTVAPTVTCKLEGGSSKSVEANSVVGQFGFALDEPQKTLYASYVRSNATGSGRTLLVKSFKLGDAAWATDELKLSLTGTGSLDPANTAVAADGGKWIAVFQDTIATNKVLLAIDKLASPTTLASGNLAGSDPDVAIAPGVPGFFVAHQWKQNAADRASGELLFVDAANKVATRYALKGDAKFVLSGIGNRILFDGSAAPPKLLYAGLLSNVKLGLPVAPTGVLIAASALSPLSPAETLVSSSQSSPSAGGVDLAPGGHLVFAKQDGASTPRELAYREPGKTTTEPVAPAGNTLVNVGQPRIAARDGLVGVVALDSTFKLHFSARDDRNGRWSADVQLPDVAAMARIVASRGATANEVVFHIAYRASTGGVRLLHQPVVCSKL